MKVITFGTFDMLHYGHIQILKRARELGSCLVVGVSTDQLNFNKKGRGPVYSEQERKFMLESIKYVDEVFFEESLEKKREYIAGYNADILVMGNDWEGQFDEFSDICKVVYLDRTPSISTTEVIELCKTIKL